jgi:hypothetical protein
MPRVIDFGLWILRGWDCELPEVWAADPDIPQGHDNASCLAWNSASVDIDLDTKPAGKTRWTTTTVQQTLHTPTDAGGALPPGYGDPYWFSFEVPVTISVTYS